MDNELITVLLSAGVIASLVTGIFSLITSLFNNKKIKQLESMKQQFFFLQKKYEALTNEYNKIASLPGILEALKKPTVSLPDVTAVSADEAIPYYVERHELLKSSVEKNIIFFDEDLKNAIDESMVKTNKARRDLSECVDQGMLGNARLSGPKVTAYDGSVVELQKKYKDLLKAQIERIQKKQQ